MCLDMTKQTYSVFALIYTLYIIHTQALQLELEVRQPHPLDLNSDMPHNSFHSRLVLHEPDLSRRWTARFHEAQLYRGNVAVVEYFACIRIGCQMIRVQIGAGSATLAVPMA